MARLESRPAFLARCTVSFLDAIAEARALALQGDVGDRLVQTLHYASDLLDIIAEGVDGLRHDSAALDSQLREQLRAASCHLAPSSTLLH
jgi:ABC-type transporter Mla subunit MlaD